MTLEAIKSLFHRDLNRLKKEIEAYSDETKMWEVGQAISNSGGNLSLHLVGNLKTYIGNGLAEIGYVRQRDLEFSAKNIPKETLLKQIEETIEVVQDALNKITNDQMDQNLSNSHLGRGNNVCFYSNALTCSFKLSFGANQLSPKIV